MQSTFKKESYVRLEKSMLDKCITYINTVSQVITLQNKKIHIFYPANFVGFSLWSRLEL